MSDIKGWGRPVNSRKFHYYGATDDNISLCRKWFVLSLASIDLDDSMDEHVENCATCQRKKLLLDKRSVERRGN